jgi:hypothetical protein
MEVPTPTLQQLVKATQSAASHASANADRAAAIAATATSAATELTQEATRLRLNSGYWDVIAAGAASLAAAHEQKAKRDRSRSPK